MNELTVRSIKFLRSWIRRVLTMLPSSRNPQSANESNCRDSLFIGGHVIANP